MLEQLKLPVGIVTAIDGASRFRIEVIGEAGHAGTVPMALRKDALAAAAEMILAVERRAVAGERARAGRDRGRDRGVAGRAQRRSRARPPSRSTSARRSMPTGCEAIEDLVAAVRRRSPRAGMSRVKVEKFYDEPAVDLRSGAGRRARGRGGPGRGRRRTACPAAPATTRLAIAALCPIAMLFVRCKGGISHNPAESITTRDADVAMRVLLDFLRHFPEPPMPTDRPLWLRQSAGDPGRRRCRVAASSWPAAGSSSWCRAGASRSCRRRRGVRCLGARRPAGPDQHPPPFLPDPDPRLPARAGQGAVPLAGRALPDLGAAHARAACASPCGWRWPSCCCPAPPPPATTTTSSATGSTDAIDIEIEEARGAGHAPGRHPRQHEPGRGRGRPAAAQPSCSARTPSSPTASG